MITELEGTGLKEGEWEIKNSLEAKGFRDRILIKCKGRLIKIVSYFKLHLCIV